MNIKTQLLEIQKDENQNLRGILSKPDLQIQKNVICLHGFERCSSTEKNLKCFQIS